MADCSIYVNDALVTDPDLDVRYVRASYVRSWEAGLLFGGRHDSETGVRLWDEVRIEESGSVTNAAEWADCGLGLQYPDAGCASFRTIPVGCARALFLRVRAVRPLLP